MSVSCGEGGRGDGLQTGMALGFKESSRDRKLRRRMTLQTHRHVGSSCSTTMSCKVWVQCKAKAISDGSAACHERRRGRAYRIQHSTHSLGMGWAVTHDLVKVCQQLGAIVSLLSQGLLRFATFRGTQRVHAWQSQRETKLDACASIELRQQGWTRHAHVRATTTP